MCLEGEGRLDLSPYVNPSSLAALSAAGPPPVYRLIGVSQHSGSLGGGHYTALARGAAGGGWHDFNDSSARPAAPPAGPSSAAYVLFYRLTES